MTGIDQGLMSELTARVSAACKLFEVILNNCLQLWTPEEAAKLKLAMTPEYMSPEVQALMAECDSSTIAVAEANPTVFANYVVMGDEYEWCVCSDFAEEDDKILLS